MYYNIPFQSNAGMSEAILAYIYTGTYLLGNRRTASVYKLNSVHYVNTSHFFKI